MTADLLKQSDQFSVNASQSIEKEDLTCNATYLYLTLIGRKHRLQFLRVPFISFEFFMFATLAIFIFLTRSFNFYAIGGIIILLYIMKQLLRRKVSGDDFKRILGIPQQVIYELNLTATTGRDMIQGITAARAERIKNSFGILLFVLFCVVYSVAMTSYNGYFSEHTVFQLIFATVLFFGWRSCINYVALHTINNHLQQRLAFSKNKTSDLNLKSTSSKLALTVAGVTFIIFLIIFIDNRLLDYHNSLNVGLTLALLSGLNGILVHLFLLRQNYEKNLSTAAVCTDQLIAQFIANED